MEDLLSARGAAVAAEVRALSDPSLLDRELAEQRLFLIRICAAPIMFFGTLWGATLVAFWLSGAVDSLDLYNAIPTMATALLGYASWRFTSEGRVRAAVYVLLTALLGIATISMIMLANIEFTSVVTYCVAVSIAAMTLERRELPIVGAIVVACATVSALAHAFPPIEPFVLPPALEILASGLGIALGMPYPMAMFWLFSRNLEKSRATAWRLAGEAEEARRVLADRTGELELKGEMLKSKNAEMSDFLYIVSHDLRAPLINIEGFSHALAESLSELGSELPIDLAGRVRVSAELGERWPALKGEIDESIDFVLRSVGKMDFLVRALLELSRIETRAPRSEKVDLNAVVDEVIASLRYRIEQRGIQVRVDPLPTIYGDQLRVSQVFGNLIDNAVKYAKAKGEASIHVTAQELPDHYVLSVRDTGIGIRPEDQAKAFRLFARLGGSGEEGDGIGLTAVKKIIEKHGGRIWLESKLGVGCSFSFTWPRDRGQPKTMEVRQDEAA